MSEPWSEAGLVTAPGLVTEPGPVSEPALPVSREPWATRSELIFALQIVLALLAIGAVAGLIWQAWSTTPTRGLAYYNNTILPDETEGFISSDGRFAVITAVIGLVAGALVWLRRSHRGPVAATALAIGTVAGAALTDVIGYLLGGGSTVGTLGTQLPRLPLNVHSTGLLFVEGTLALLLYLLGSLFAEPDDLGVAKLSST